MNIELSANKFFPENRINELTETVFDLMETKGYMITHMSGEKEWVDGQSISFLIPLINHQFKGIGRDWEMLLEKVGFNLITAKNTRNQTVRIVTVI